MLDPDPEVIEVWDSDTAEYDSDDDTIKRLAASQDLPRSWVSESYRRIFGRNTYN